MPNELRHLEVLVPASRAADPPPSEALYMLAWALLRRRWLIFCVFVVFALAGAQAALREPDVRGASAKILLKPDRISLHIANLSPDSARSPYSPEKLKSELEVIRSRDVLLPVAKKLAAERNRDDDEDAVESIVHQLESGVHPAAFSGTGVIEIEYRATDAAQAQRMLELIIAQYKEHHAVAYGVSDDLLRFYETEEAQARSKLEAAEESYRAWQAENHIVAIDDEIRGLLTRQSDLERELAQAANDRQITIDRDPLLGRLQGDLVTANVDLQGLLQRYTEQDRRVREKREQIALVRGQIASAEQGLATSLRRREEAIRKDLQTTTTSVEALRAKKVDGDRLARTVETSNESFRLFGRRLEESRVAAKLDRDQLSELSVIESPHVTDYSNEDERWGLFLLSSAVGLGLGAVIALALAFFHRSIRTRREVERFLELPVLATIPDLRSVPL